MIAIKKYNSKLTDWSAEMPNAPYSNRWGLGKKKYNNNKGGQHEKILHLFGFTVPGECC